jgi:hypothetical protein
MSRIKCDAVSLGAVPSERVARFKTADGIAEEVVVSAQQVEGEFLRVYAIQPMGDRVLVELPREAASGSWRLWVSKNHLIEDRE